MDRQSVNAVGGIAVFADHADTLAHWYEQHLGLFFTREPGSHEWWCAVGGVTFTVRQSKHPMGRDRRTVEIAWRVPDLDAFLEQLAELGVTVDEKKEAPDGDHAWFSDPEGNRIELWQLPDA